MIELYFAPTANGRRAAMSLEETGLSYTLHRISLAQKSPALLKRNPGGYIPVIEDSDGPNHKPIVIAQSGAILLYLAEKTGRFIPSDPVRRVVAMQCFMFACSDIAGTSAAILAAAEDVVYPQNSIHQIARSNVVKRCRTRTDSGVA